jgi:hypothetical protein
MTPSKTSSREIAEAKDDPRTALALPAKRPSRSRLPITEATVDEVWSRLGEHGVRGVSSYPSWDEFIKVRGGEGAGRVRDTADWRTLPEGKPVRVVALTVGDTIELRWASADAFERRREKPMHERMFRYGEGPARSGYITREGDSLRIQG